MKKHTSFFITKELKDLMEWVIDKEEIPKTLFLKRAIRRFLEGDQYVDPRVLITKRTDPDYIRRDECIMNYIDEDQYATLEEVARKKNCKVAQLIFQALVEYTSGLIQTMDGIFIVDKGGKNNEKTDDSFDGSFADDRMHSSGE